MYAFIAVRYCWQLALAMNMCSVSPTTFNCAYAKCLLLLIHYEFILLSLKINLSLCGCEYFFSVGEGYTAIAPQPPL